MDLPGGYSLVLEGYRDRIFMNIFNKTLQGKEQIRGVTILPPRTGTAQSEANGNTKLLHPWMMRRPATRITPGCEGQTLSKAWSKGLPRVQRSQQRGPEHQEASWKHLESSSSKREASSAT